MPSTAEMGSILGGGKAWRRSTPLESVMRGGTTENEVCRISAPSLSLTAFWVEVDVEVDVGLVVHNRHYARDWELSHVPYVARSEVPAF